MLWNLFSPGRLAAPVAASLGHRGWMKLLRSSSERCELEWLAKRLARIGIPCAVSKDSGDSQLSVWIQQDADFPLALNIFVNRARPRRFPPWACLFGSPVPGTEESGVPATEDFALLAGEGFALPASEDFALAALDGMDTTRVMVVQPKWLTRTATA